MDISKALVLQGAFEAIEEDIKALMLTKPIPLGDARTKAPNERGVYVIFSGEDIFYIGEAAKGRSGIKDRLGKHLSGDEGHALQKHFEEEYPDRLTRREHVATLRVCWRVIESYDRAVAVERILLWLHRSKIINIK